MTDGKVRIRAIACMLPMCMARRYAVDRSRLSEMGWKASTSFEAGLITTINW